MYDITIALIVAIFLRVFYKGAVKGEYTNYASTYDPDFDLGVACSNVSKFSKGTSKPSTTKSWSPYNTQEVGGDFGKALNGLPKQDGDELHYVLGTVKGKVRYERMDTMPHLLVAGTTGSGKSVFINCLIASLLARHTPSTLRLGLIDPKQVEFASYNGLPHLIGGRVAHDTTGALPIVQWCVDEMQRRLELLTRAKVKDLSSYNSLVPVGRRLPRVLLVVDEFADLILSAFTKEEKEEVKSFEIGLTRLAQKARAVGIHLLLSTQKPLAKVVTPILKGNIPARVALRVANGSDSRVILDQNGAEDLNGKGDMLFQSPTVGGVERVQGLWVPEETVLKMIGGA